VIRHSQDAKPDETEYWTKSAQNVRLWKRASCLGVWEATYMNRISRAAVATAMAATVALGASAPAAVAGPPEHAKGAHAKAAKAKADKGVTAQSDKAERRAAQVERKLDRQIARKSAFLTRVERSNKLTSLEDAYGLLVRGNVTGDVTDLEGISARVDAATTLGELRVLATDVRAVRPAVYHTIINQVRRATAMQAVAADAADVLALLDPALDALSAFDATTPRSDLRAVQQTLAAAADLLEAVEEDELSEEETPDSTDGDTEPAPDAGTGTPTEPVAEPGTEV
jgi:hypothetical protein